MNRPKCLHCEQVLRKYVRSVRVLLDCPDVNAFITKKLGTQHWQFTQPDKFAKAMQRKHKDRADWRERQDEARAALCPGSNTAPDTTTLSGKTAKWRFEETLNTGVQFDVYAQVWVKGEYGYDGCSYFHSQTCAADWARNYLRRTMPVAAA